MREKERQGGEGKGGGDDTEERRVREEVVNSLENKLEAGITVKLKKGSINCGRTQRPKTSDWLGQIILWKRVETESLVTPWNVCVEHVVIVRTLSLHSYSTLYSCSRRDQTCIYHAECKITTSQLLGTVQQ